MSDLVDGVTSIALNDSCAEAVMPWDVSKVWYLQTFHSSEERFQSLHDTFDLAPYIVSDFALPVSDEEDLPQVFVIARLGSLSSFNEKCPLLKPMMEDRINQKFSEFDWYRKWRCCFTSFLFFLCWPWVVCCIAF